MWIEYTFVIYFKNLFAVGFTIQYTYYQLSLMFKVCIILLHFINIFLKLWFSLFTQSVYIIVAIFRVD